MKVSTPEPQGPTPEEIAASERAKRERIESTQDNNQTETDRLFRLYVARGGFGF